MTDEGRARLNEGGMEGAYFGEDGEVHIPGKRVTLYSDPSPPQPSNQQVSPIVPRVRITELHSYFTLCRLGLGQILLHVSLYYEETTLYYYYIIIDV